MVITLKRSYPKLNEDGTRKLDKNGQAITVFVYGVTGTKEDLDEYERIQTEAEVKTIKDGHGYLWFTTQPIGVKGKLKVSTNGKIYADTTALDLANSLIKQYGRLGETMAKDILRDGIITEDAPAPEVVPNGKGIDSLD